MTDTDLATIAAKLKKKAIHNLGSPVFWKTGDLQLILVYTLTTVRLTLSRPDRQPGRREVAGFLKAFDGDHADQVLLEKIKTPHNHYGVRLKWPSPLNMTITEADGGDLIIATLREE